MVAFTWLAVTALYNRVMPDMKDKAVKRSLVLFGGEGLSKEAQAVWVRALPAGCRITVVPAALGAQKVNKIDYRTGIIRDTLTGLGFIPQILELRRRADANQDETVALVQGAECVFLTGGEPMAALELLDDSIMWRMLLERLADGMPVLAGAGSAASMGEYLFQPLRPFPPSLAGLEVELRPALGLFPQTIVVPFSNWLQEAFIDRLSSLAKPVRIQLRIEQDAALIIDDLTWQCGGKGSVSVYVDGQLSVKLSPDERIANSTLSDILDGLGTYEQPAP